METINVGLLINLATSIVSSQTITSTSSENTLPHHLNCSLGKIFLYSAYYSSPDNRLPDTELEELYRDCSYVKRCNFKTELNNESTINYACEDKNLHFLPDVMENVLEIESKKSLFYYDGIQYQETGQGFLCVIKPLNEMNLYANWIRIQNTSKTVLEMVVLGRNSNSFSAGSSIYRSNTRVNSSVTLKLLPDPSQHDQISLGFTTTNGTLDVNCSIFEISGTVITIMDKSTVPPHTVITSDRSTNTVTITSDSEDSEKRSPSTNTIIIIVCVVGVAIIAIIIVVVCIYRKRKKRRARREERGVKLTKAVSEANNYSATPKENNKQLELHNNDYATSANVTNPQNTFNNTSCDDVTNTSVSRDGKKIINMKQLESRVKSSGYSEPIDSVEPIKISSKAGDYAEPCNERECFTSKCLQNKAMLQNYPKSGGNAYSHVVGKQSEDNYDHFDRVKDNNSRLPDGNYSHIPEKGLQHNTTRNILSEETTSNPNYDHI